MTRPVALCDESVDSLKAVLTVARPLRLGVENAYTAVQLGVEVSRSRAVYVGSCDGHASSIHTSEQMSSAPEQQIEPVAVGVLLYAVL